MHWRVSVDVRIVDVRPSSYERFDAIDAAMKCGHVQRRVTTFVACLNDTSTRLREHLCQEWHSIRRRPEAAGEFNELGEWVLW